MLRAIYARGSNEPLVPNLFHSEEFFGAIRRIFARQPSIDDTPSWPRCVARPLRLEVPDGNYHVWNRGVNRADIVVDDRDRQLFIDLLQEVIRRFGWIIH